MTPLQKSARLAGVLYVLMALTGPFVLIYVPSKLFVTGNPAATAANILANQGLFRAYILVGLVSTLAFIATVLALYRLLKDVHRGAALLMVILVLLQIPSEFLSLANQIATLTLVRSPAMLAGFEGPMRDTLAMWLITIDHAALPLDNFFWGVWLFPLAMLVYRSGFLPRFLGVWLFLNAIAYIVASIAGILTPEFANAISIYSMPILLGELVFAFWLLIVGAKTNPFKRSEPAKL